MNFTHFQNSANSSISEIFLTLKAKFNRCFIFESLDGETANSKRWSYVGVDGNRGIRGRDQLIEKYDASTNKIIETIKIDNNTSFAKVIAEELKPFENTLDVDSAPPFIGGYVGYFSFEFFKWQEPKLSKVFGNCANKERDFWDFDMLFFDKVIAIDNELQEIWVICNDESSLQMLSDLMSYEKHHEQIKPEKLELFSIPKYQFTESEFVNKVNILKEHIVAGDIFQAVISNKLSWNAKGSLFDVYEKLREINPSPYMFYMAGDEVEIAGAAPETLVSVDRDSIVKTFPLAGTRPRGKNVDEDECFEKELLADEKERAEHNMLVDLARNDIGKIAELGTVNVDDYMKIHRYSHVMHIGSVVSGVAKKPGIEGALESLGSILPAGTLSGAPKIRAVEIISELENDARGVYGGCVGLISINGVLDMAIAIRTALMRKFGDGTAELTARSGAGIVFDSDPKSEYSECTNKLAAVRSAIEECAK